MKQITFIAIAIFIVTIMTAYGQTNRYVPEGWKVFETSKFSILYPDSFELVDASDLMKESFMLFPTQSLLDGLHRKIGLLIFDLYGLNVSLDRVVEIQKSQIKKLIDGNIIESKKNATSNFEFHSIIFTTRFEQRDYKRLERIIVKGEQIYHLSFTAEESQFDNYIEIATKIMDSFKIK